MVRNNFKNKFKGAIDILKIFNQNGYEAYFVGGCVRDYLLGEDFSDIDITTNALPDEVKKVFRKSIDTGIQHGTVTILVNGDSYEVTTFRTEEDYTNHRSPEKVEFVSNLREDLDRRDFTINAMALDYNGKLFDYHNGDSDLSSKIIRTVNNPNERFYEDALRMLRAFRFSSKLSFEIENNTLNAIKKNAELIKFVSIERIVNEFKKLYPHLPPNTCQLVDYSVNYAEDLVIKFDTDDEFRVAVSVDMLDTGIDVPSVLNLMFFKPVRSKIKFVQMIGRGTRLCSDLFGPGNDKKKFLIFDYCDNFEYFQVDHNEVISGSDKISLSQRIFILRTEIAYSLQDFESQEDEFLRNYRDKTVRILSDNIRDLKNNTNRISVRQNLKYVDKYNSDKSWMALTPVNIHELKSFVAPLIEGGSDSDFKALSFDIRMMRIQMAILKNAPAYATSDIKKVREIAQYLLQNKMTIPQVEAKKDDLKELYAESSWIEPRIKNLERLRNSIRELIKYITGDELRLIDIDVSDELIDPEFQPDGTVMDIRTYKERVIDYLSKNGDDVTIEKIRNLEKLDQKDADKLKQLLWFDLGSEDEYNENANGKNLAAFVRSLIGIDQEAVNEKFSEYLNMHKLNSKQQEFINVIVKYVQKNGDIELSDLLEYDPFKSIDWTELFGGNVDPIKYAVSVLHDAITS